MVTAIDPKPWRTLFVKLCLGGLLAILLICVVSYELRRREILTREIAETEAVVEMQSTSIDFVLHRIRADLLILSRQSELDAEKDDPTQHDALAQEFIEFSRAIGGYDNVQLVDAKTGTAILQVENLDEIVRLMPYTSAVDPLNRADLAELAALPPGCLWMSPLRTSPTDATRPVLRFATTATPRGSGFSTAIFLDYRADRLLGYLDRLTKRANAQFIFTDRNGIWLSHPYRYWLWDADQPDDSARELIRSHPRIWQAIHSGGSGTVRGVEGIFVFRTVFLSTQGFCAPVDRSEPDPALKLNAWKVIGYVSPETVAKIEGRILETLVPFAIAASIACGLAAWMFTVYWERRRQQHSSLRRSATTDPLTGALNRAGFDEALSRALSGEFPQSPGCALIFIDMDDFKAINDTFGHDAGDACLKETVLRLRDCCRDSDQVARLGGDEFVVILPNCRGRAAAQAVAGKIDAALSAAPAPYPGATEPIRASLGVAVYPEDGVSAEMLLRTADAAMYGAKRDRHGNPQRKDDPEK